MNQISSSFLQDIRKEYELGILDLTTVNQNPKEQFQAWLQEALASEILEPTAMHLSTVSGEGRPSGRIVLLKGYEQGPIFYTNYQSRKGQDIQSNAYASLTFFWDKLERQVRIEGKIVKISDEKSDEYFKSRPFKSQIGAIVSPQSQPIKDRAILESEMEAGITHWDGKEIARPLHWGGYELIPDYYEFWQGRRSRLHDRITYSLKENNAWLLERLAP